MTKRIIAPLILGLTAIAACGGSGPSQQLPGPTSASRIGLDGEVIETMRFEYVAGGRLSARISNDRQIHFFYDADQRLALIDFEDEEIVYHYDGLDRVERFERHEVESKEILQTTRYVYDSADPARVLLREDELPRSVIEPKRTFQYRYDAAGRLVEEQPMSKGSEVEYVYVNNGVLRHRDTDGVRRLYEFDEHGNMLSERAVSVQDETRVHEEWIYGYEGWEGASDEEKNAARTITPYMSATVR